MTTTVINIKDAPKGWENNPAYAYIGRAGRGQEGKWGNPFVLYGPNPKLRTSVLSQYRYWLLESPLEYRNEMAKELTGRTLVCFCKPLSCHGDFIAEYLDTMHYDF